MDLKFEDLCAMFEKLHTTIDATKKKNILREFYSNYKSQHPNTSFHPLLRLIIPDADRERGPYGIKALRFAQLIINIYCIPPQSQQALRLLKYQSMCNRDIMDFADAAVGVLHKKLTGTGDMTVKTVNEHLDALAQLNKDNNARKWSQNLDNFVKITNKLQAGDVLSKNPKIVFFFLLEIR